MTLALATGAGALARLVYGRATSGPNGYDGLSVRGPVTQPVTPTDRFYVVTKNIVDPRVDAALWRLQTTGLVDHPTTLDLDGVRAVSRREALATSGGISGLLQAPRWERCSDLLRFRAIDVLRHQHRAGHEQAGQRVHRVVELPVHHR